MGKIINFSKQINSCFLNISTQNFTGNPRSLENRVANTLEVGITNITYLYLKKKHIIICQKN